MIGDTNLAFMTLRLPCHARNQIEGSDGSGTSVQVALLYQVVLKVVFGASMPEMVSTKISDVTTV